MAGKTKKKTFAQRAKDLDRKFKNKENDPIIMRDYVNALRTLRDEQEQVRAKMGMTNETEFRRGGQMRVSDGRYSYDDSLGFLPFNIFQLGGILDHDPIVGTPQAFMTTREDVERETPRPLTTRPLVKMTEESQREPTSLREVPIKSSFSVLTPRWSPIAKTTFSKELEDFGLSLPKDATFQQIQTELSRIGPKIEEGGYPKYRAVEDPKTGKITYQKNFPSVSTQVFGKGDIKTRRVGKLGTLPERIEETEQRRYAPESYAGGGGLSRKKDYGSKKKPYPSVKSSDFAGKGRSYPIPTKADAIDALRLAGLHGRSDIRAKVFKRYPSLKKRAMGGKMLYQDGDFLPRINAPVENLQSDTFPMNNQYLGLPFRETGTLDPTTEELINSLGTDQTGGQGAYTTFPNRAILPASISAGATIAGNIPGLRTEAQEINLPQLMPTQVSDARNREIMKRQAGEARRLALARARGNLSDIGVATAGTQRALGEGLSRSFGQEAQLNAAERARINQINAQNRAREQMFNAQQRQLAAQQRQQAVQGIATGLTQAAGDVLAGQQEAQLLSSMQTPSGYRVLFNPETGTYDRVFTGEGFQGQVYSPRDYRRLSRQGLLGG